MSNDDNAKKAALEAAVKELVYILKLNEAKRKYLLVITEEDEWIFDTCLNHENKITH